MHAPIARSIRQGFPVHANPPGGDCRKTVAGKTVASSRVSRSVKDMADQHRLSSRLPRMLEWSDSFWTGGADRSGWVKSPGLKPGLTVGWHDLSARTSKFAGEVRAALASRNGAFHAEATSFDPPLPAGARLPGRSRIAVVWWRRVVRTPSAGLVDLGPWLRVHDGRVGTRHGRRRGRASVRRDRPDADLAIAAFL